MIEFVVRDICSSINLTGRWEGAIKNRFLVLASGRGHTHEIFSFFELFGFLGFRRHFMIIVDAINNCLERVDAVDRILRIILCINRYELAIDCMPIVHQPDLALHQSISRFGYGSLANEQGLTG